MAKKISAAKSDKDKENKNSLIFTQKLNLRLDKLAFEKLESYAGDYRIPISTAARRILQDYFYGVKR
jgi:hypothetical protein